MRVRLLPSGPDLEFVEGTVGRPCTPQIRVVVSLFREVISSRGVGHTDLGSLEREFERRRAKEGEGESRKKEVLSSRLLFDQ